MRTHLSPEAQQRLDDRVVANVVAVSSPASLGVYARTCESVRHDIEIQLLLDPRDLSPEGTASLVLHASAHVRTVHTLPARRRFPGLSCDWGQEYLDEE